MTTRELLFSCWRADPLALALGAAAVGGYLYYLRRKNLEAKILPFGLALVTFFLALASPIGALADGYLFSAHMLQHLLLVLVVPPLALMAIPATGAGKRRWLPALVAWGLGVGAMWLWHAPTLCNAASRMPSVQRLQQLSFLIMGGAFWWPIVGPRERSRLPPLSGVVYLFTACVACTVLGIVITFSPVEVCSIFLHPNDRLGLLPLLRGQWGLSVEKDQEIGGLIMWVPACLVYGAGIMGLLARWYGQDAAPSKSTKSIENASEAA